MQKQSSNLWTYTCPCCNKEIIEKDKTVDFIKQHIGATHDCPECGALLMIEEDTSCSDFTKTLIEMYRQAGVKGTDEEIKRGMGYIEFH